MLVRYAGIATHYVHSSSLPDLQGRLAELNFKDYADLQERYEIVNHTIEEFFTGLPHDEGILLAGSTREQIDRCFKFNKIGEILRALNDEKDHAGGDWAIRTLETLEQRSPTSLRVALHQMRVGRQWGIAEVFEREHSIASQFMEHEDFIEGVSARLIKKPPKQPNWQPLKKGATDASVIEPFFQTEGKQRLQLLNQGGGTNYQEYPHSWLGLPREVDVERIVQNGGRTRTEIIEHFANLKNEQPGTREKVQDILERKTVEDEVGKSISWRS